MIFIVQYLLWQSGQQKKDSKQASKHSDARQYWMIDSNQSKTKMNDHSSGGKIYNILQESFTTCYHGYELLKRFSDIFQSYLVINQLTLMITKSYLPRVSAYFPFTVTNFKVAVCHFVQAKVIGISGLSFSTISSTFLRKEESIHLPFAWINLYFSDTNYHISQKRTGCDLAAIHFRIKQVIYYHNQTSNIFYLFGWINRASARTIRKGRHDPCTNTQKYK